MKCYVNLAEQHMVFRDIGILQVFDTGCIYFDFFPLELQFSSESALGTTFSTHCHLCTVKKESMRKTMLCV